MNHAFASAIAPVDKYDEKLVSDALSFLGQDPDSDLECVYCQGVAETWDHLVGLVKKGQLRGYGHQIGNLVPCCRECNSSKGGKEFRVFIEQSPRIKVDRKALIGDLEGYLKRLAKPVNIVSLSQS